MFEINQKLKQSVLENMPEDYSNLEKALYIYQELCQLLDYSMPFYLEKEKVINYFTDPNNLILVDGDKNKEVVCYSFNAIYLQILIDEGICNENILNKIAMVDGKFEHRHSRLDLIIDDLMYRCDATYGVLDNNDLALSKYSPSFKGWHVEFEEAGQKELLQKAIEKVSLHHSHLMQLEDEYLKAKLDDRSLLDIPFEERKEIFIDTILNSAPKYSVQTFNYILRLMRYLFDNRELTAQSIDCEIYTLPLRRNAKLAIQFAKNKNSGEFECLLLTNPKGYTDDLGYENFDALEICKISLFKHTIENLDMDVETFKK